MGPDSHITDFNSVSAPSTGGPHGWLARLDLGFQADSGRTRLARCHHQGPLQVQRPFYPEGPVSHVYLLHPPGGVVGGDRLEVGVDVSEGADVLITTPGCTKLYRSAGPISSLQQRLRVAAGGTLEWLPLETIAYPGAHAEVTTIIELEGDARVAAWEIQCLGLPASGERFLSGELGFRFELWRDGEPWLLERLRVMAEELINPAGLRGYPVCGTFVVNGVREPERDLARRVADDLQERGNWGISLIEDMLVVRYLGISTARAQEVFRGVWRALRPLLFGREACSPRIWST